MTTALRICASLLLGLTSALALAQTGAAEPRSLSKEDWVVHQISCPFGCSAYTRNFLAKQVGRAVHLSAQRVEVPFDDSCNGTPIYSWYEQSTPDLLQELKLGHGPGRRVSAKSLKLGDKPVTGARVFCEEASGKNLIARLLTVEPTRILILFEEQSLIELR